MTSLPSISSNSMQYLIQQATQVQANKTAKPTNTLQSSFADAVNNVTGNGTSSAASAAAGGTQMAANLSSSTAASLLNIMV